MARKKEQKKELKDLNVEEQEATDVKGGFAAKEAIRRARVRPSLSDPTKPAKDKFLPEPGP